MSLRTAVMVVLCMTAAFASDVDKVVPEEQFNNVQPMYQSLVQSDTDAVDEKKIDPMEDHDHMMFTPHDDAMPKVPAGAGNTEKFTREADAQMTSAHAAKASHELKSVEDRGLAIVAGLMKKRAREQREVEQDHKVAETMNRAAALAGVFKTDVTSFNKHKLAVDKEVLDVKAQMDIVAGFKKQLKAGEGAQDAREVHHGGRCSQVQGEEDRGHQARQGSAGAQGQGQERQGVCRGCREGDRQGRGR